MSDAAWGFWGAVVGSLIGGLIAYLVAFRAAKVQIEAHRSIEAEKQSRDLLLRFLREIDEYVHLSFRPGEENKLNRQRAFRVMLTTALIVIPDEVEAIANQCYAVENYHRAKESGARGRITNFSVVRDYFAGLQNRLCQKAFNLRSPLFEAISEPQIENTPL